MSRMLQSFLSIYALEFPFTITVRSSAYARPTTAAERRRRAVNSTVSAPIPIPMLGVQSLSLFELDENHRPPGIIEDARDVQKDQLHIFAGLYTNRYQYLVKRRLSASKEAVLLFRLFE
ncbi:hypothetical protein EVAR_6213_1 [Eumeta japonica]|uniref:Uncharacterized protein n=1 Tax=Eumeta variegata TaxID=151549 RepID=A0A4C1Z401_EUMVA|nr:hypothetical protein EVAR_6213_1 [Eumeta japonica]